MARRTYTERRKADREAMAKELVEAVIEAGGKAQISRDAQFIEIHISVPGGAIISVDFDGKSRQPDIHVCTWNVASDSDSRFADIIGNVNEFHHAKANVVADGFDALKSELVADIAHFVDGCGYSEERKAYHIAKNGTAAERNARFEKWRQELKAEKRTDA